MSRPLIRHARHRAIARALSASLPLITSYLATTQCLMKVLELVGPLVTIVKGLDRTPDIIPFLRAADQLAPCEFAATPGGMLPFMRDVICVLIQALNCVIEQSNSLIDLLTSLSARLQSARATENAELIRALESEIKNLQTRMAALFNSIDPVEVFLNGRPLSSVFRHPGATAAFSAHWSGSDVGHAMACRS